jgi:hypothetical protein
MKRELVLITGFALAGLAAWQLTAPPAEPGRSGFSLAAIRDGFRNLRGAQVPAEVRRSAALTLSGPVTHVDLPEIAGELDIRGGPEQQVTAELEGTIFVTDEAAAATAVEQVSLDIEQQGAQVRVVFKAPPSRRSPRVRLVVRVPSTATVRLTMSGERLEVRDVAGLRAEVRRAQTAIAGVSGQVELEQRDGSADLERVGSLILESRRATIDVRHLAGPMRGEVNDGRLSLRHVEGPIELETRRAGVEIEEAAAGVRLTAQDGTAAMRRVGGRLRYDGRRCGLTLENDVDIVIEATSSDEHLQLTLPARALTLDVSAEEGSLELPDTGFPDVTREGNRHRAAGEVGGGGPLVKIRGARSHIVLRR